MSWRKEFKFKMYKICKICPCALLHVKWMLMVMLILLMVMRGECDPDNKLCQTPPPPPPPRDQRLTILFPKYRFILLELLIRYTLESHHISTWRSSYLQILQLLILDQKSYSSSRSFSTGAQDDQNVSISGMSYKIPSQNSHRLLLFSHNSLRGIT